MTSKTSQVNMAQELDSVDTDLHSKTLDLTIQDKLRASSVKRWHIVATSKQQTLAEHSFNVAVIAMAIVEARGGEHRIRTNYKILKEALEHDLDEVVMGDIPTPAKDQPYYPWGDPVCPKQIVKMADVIDAYTFIQKYNIDDHGKEVANYLYNIWADMCGRLPETWAIACRRVTNQILCGNYTI